MKATMKHLLTAALLAVSLPALAGTYTWTGAAGDGLWSTPANWNYNGEPASSQPANNFAASDSVLINGNYTVSYDRGGDLSFSGTLTVSGGATWRQGYNAWPTIPGTIVVDNGSFYSGENQGTHGNGYGHLEVRNGGLFKIERGLNNGFIYQSMLVESNGRVEVYGNDLVLKAADRVDATGVVYCDQNVILPAGVRPGAGTIVANHSSGLLKPQDGAVLKGVDWECRLIHPDAGAVVMLRSGSLRLVDSWSNGFEQETGTYLDFVTGSTCTLYLKSFTSDVYEKTFGSDATNPKFRLNGQIVSAADFATKFTVADAGDGFASITLNNSATSALFDETSIGVGTSDSSVRVSATFESIGEPAATVYLAYATSDLGRNFSAWPDKIVVGTASAAGFDAAVVSGIPAKANLTFRLFIGTAEEFDVSDPVSFYTRYYGEELVGQTVREWVGGGDDNKFTTQANWLNGIVPAKNGDWYRENVVVDLDAEVDYNGWGDLMPQGGVIVKISGGARLVQSVGNWPNIYGLLILDNGTFDCTRAGEFRLRAPGEVRILNGGVLRYQNTFTRDDNATVVLRSGAIQSTGFYRATVADTYEGGVVRAAGEFRYIDGTVVDGTAIEAAKLVAVSAGDVITFQSGSLTVTGTGDYGFANNGGYIEVPSDSTASFTFPFSRAQIEANVLSKFRLNGIEFSRFDDDEWQIVEIADGDATRTTFTHKAVSGQLPLIENLSAVVNGETATSATISATLVAGAPLESLNIKYGTDRVNLTQEQAFSGNVTGLADGASVSFDLTGLLPHKKYYFQIVAKNEVGETATLLIDAATFITFVPTSDSAVWTGAENNAANNPRNWLNGVVPTASSDIMIADVYAERKTIVWNLPITINSWTQESFGGESVFVSFQTTAANPLTVTGNVRFDTGTWTHGGPSDDPTEMVNLSVGGNMTIGSTARIVVGTAMNTDDHDGRPRGYTRSHGPGYLRAAGGSYAGEGGHIPSATGFVSYGSILNPLSYGSGGHGDNVGYAGGGVVKLSVGGALTMDGIIRSRGFGYPLNDAGTVGGAGSGGSINITAASLSGAGTIDANGGANGLYGPGSGGRVKVALTGAGATFDTFTGRIEAVGGSMEGENQCATYDISPAAAGTVCLQAPGADPVVKVFNEFRHAGIGQEGTAVTWRVPAGESVAPATHLPAMQNGDSPAALKTTHWELSGHGAIRLTADTRVYSLTLANDDGSQCVYTEGHTLRVNALTVAGTALHGVHTAATLPSIVAGNGSIVVDDAVTVILLK